MEKKILFIALGLVIAEILVRLGLKSTRNRKLRKIYKEILEWVDTGVVALVLALFIMTFIIQAFAVPTESMEPGILGTKYYKENLVKSYGPFNWLFHTGDHLFVNKFIYGFKVPFSKKRILQLRKPKRGDVIVFVAPLKATSGKKKDFIKRCIGVPGDTVVLKNKVLYINGEKQLEPYICHKDSRIYPPEYSPRDNFGPLQVPAGSYFAMGDNRDHSFDGRFWGPVPQERIKGRAWFVYWPPTRWRIIR